MDEQEQTRAAVFALSAAFVCLCKTLEENSLIRRSQVAEAIQERYIQEKTERGLAEAFLEPLRLLAVHLAEVPGAP